MNPAGAFQRGQVSQDRRRGERRGSPSLVAYHWKGFTPCPNHVRDISATGVYVLTDEDWHPGASVDLTLQREGLLESQSDRRCTLSARIIRKAGDGVALEFELSEGAKPRLWYDPLMRPEDAEEPESIVREFRVAEALAFLRRIAPAASRGIEQLFRENLSHFRLSSAVEIALKAKELLAPHPDAEDMLADPELVTRILQSGSWADLDAIRHLWAGLLATSCSPREYDGSNLPFVELLGQLTPIQIRILAAVCATSRRPVTAPNLVFMHPAPCTPEELVRATGVRDLIRIHRDISNLADLGLIEQKVTSAFYTPNDEANITPTPLALELYARCSGHRGASRDFYHLLNAEA